MGFFWAVVHPLVLLVAYTFVFSGIFNVRPAGSRTDSFALFLFAGLLPWLYFQDTLLRSCSSIVNHAHLIRKTLFPSEILPLAVALSNIITHLIGLLILCGVLLFNGLLGWTGLQSLLCLFFLVFLSLGLGWLTAVFQVFVRDTQQVVTVVLIFWFWLTPIFYTLEQVPERFRPLVRLNPLTYVVEGYRQALLEQQLVSAETLLILALAGSIAFVLGGIIFRVTKREFVDVL